MGSGAQKAMSRKFVLRHTEKNDFILANPDRNVGIALGGNLGGCCCSVPVGKSADPHLYGLAAPRLLLE